MHWGTEYLPVPQKSIRRVAFKLKVFGAALIVGTHPHVVQGHEWTESTLVVYSLGNFLFPRHRVHGNPVMYQLI